MGINGILPKLLPTAGRENYDLRALKDGIITLTAAASLENNEQSQQQPPPSKRRRRTNDTTKTISSSSGGGGNGRWTRRKVRIAVDVNGWISRAAHGYGGTLMDERHLSYQGRAHLRNEQQQQLEGTGEEEKEDGETNDNVVATNTNNNQQQQQQLEQQQRLEYIQKIVSFTLKRIESMKEACSALVLPVLDGNTPPCKLEVVRERSARRRRAVEERDQLLVTGEGDEQQQQQDDDDVENEAARTEAEVLNKISASKRGGMGKDYSMRRDLLAELLNEFRKRKWPFLVAPYEADGQLAYLANTGAVDLVVTEDSDLIGLGVPTLVYKLGGWNGSSTANRGGPTFGPSGTSASSSHLGTLLHRRDLGSAGDINLLDFSDAMLATMFVAAGCDYCPNLKGIGIVTARNIVKRAFHGVEAGGDYSRRSEPVLKLVLHALFGQCNKEARGELFPLDDPNVAAARLAYERKFLAGLAMYRHPLVYDPIQGVHVISNDVSNGNESQSPTFSMDEKILMEYEPYRKLVTDRELLYEVIGKPSSPEIAEGIAQGVIDPRRIPNENDHTAIENDGQQDTVIQNGQQDGDEEGESSTQPSNELLSSQDFSGAGTQRSSELLSSQDYSGAGTQQSKFSQSSTSEGLSSPDLLTSPSSAVKGLLV